MSCSFSVSKPSRPNQLLGGLSGKLTEHEDMCQSIYTVMHKLIEFETQSVMHTSQVVDVITSRRNGRGLDQAPK